ncbi:MAG: HEPN domain-containing protein [Nitrospira sp.]|nr:HEPN domain-containing protein [Nitrospira sp.]
MSKQEIAGLLTKARRSIKAAERLLQDGDYDFAVSRAYYGMFYVAQAMLLTRDLRRSKHSGVIAAFQEHFVKSGDVPDRYFHLLRDGFEDRAEGDYGFAEIGRDQAEAGIEAARQFITELGRRFE